MSGNDSVKRISGPRQQSRFSAYRGERIGTERDSESSAQVRKKPIGRQLGIALLFQVLEFQIHYRRDEQIMIVDVVLRAVGQKLRLPRSEPNSYMRVEINQSKLFRFPIPLEL